MGQDATALLIDRDCRSSSVQRSKKILQDRPVLLGKPKQPAHQVKKSGLFADIQQLEQFRPRVPSQSGEKPLGLVGGITLTYALKIVDYSCHGCPQCFATVDGRCEQNKIAGAIVNPA